MLLTAALSQALDAIDMQQDGNLVSSSPPPPGQRIKVASFSGEATGETGYGLYFPRLGKMGQTFLRFARNCQNVNFTWLNTTIHCLGSTLRWKLLGKD